jgi:hypothetical protein
MHVMPCPVSTCLSSSVAALVAGVGESASCGGGSCLGSAATAGSGGGGGLRDGLRSILPAAADALGERLGPGVGNPLSVCTCLSERLQR